MGPARATAVIAAAGSGERLGAGGPKAFVALAGRPMIEWSLRAASEAGIAEIVVAAPPGHEPECERAIAAVPGCRGRVVTGGDTRARSVRAALALVETELVLVHDAARPLAGGRGFALVLERLLARPEVDAVIAAAPVADTLKRASAGRRIEATVSRERLWAAQTPQGFRTAALQAAQRAAEERGQLDEATDEAMLVEAAGGTVVVEPLEGPNPKVTSPVDLELARALLDAEARSQRQSST